MITATYYPISYGPVGVSATGKEITQFIEAVPQLVSGSGPTNPGGPQMVYRVDLRELELKAAKAQAEAERAQRELSEARLQRQIDESRR
jgi:hypothetical protein